MSYLEERQSEWGHFSEGRVTSKRQGQDLNRDPFVRQTNSSFAVGEGDLALINCLAKQIPQKDF